MKPTALPALAALALTGCGSSLHQVTAAEFVELAEQPNSRTYAATYVGWSRNWPEARARVYLEVWSMGTAQPSGTDVYWAPLSEFSRAHVDAVRAGEDPFTGSAGAADR